MIICCITQVRQGQANSHSKKGWETFTDSTIKEVSKKGKNLVFFLWGNHAQQKERFGKGFQLLNPVANVYSFVFLSIISLLIFNSIIDSKSHLILKAAHPSGLSAHKGFFGCR